MTSRPLPAGEPPPRLRALPGRTSRSFHLGWWMAFSLTVVAAFFGLILSRTALDRSAFVLEELHEQMALEEARYEELRLEVARLRSPQRVLQAAEDMGLLFPTRVETVMAPGIVQDDPSVERRWAQVKSILAARP